MPVQPRGLKFKADSLAPDWKSVQNSASWKSPSRMLRDLFTYQPIGLRSGLASITKRVWKPRLDSTPQNPFLYAARSASSDAFLTSVLEVLRANRSTPILS